MYDPNTSIILEALLLSSDAPLTIEQMQETLADLAFSPENIRQALDQLAKDYTDRAIELKQVASGYCIQTKKQYHVWVSRLYTEKPIKYSRAFLETLAIIAYQQPVTRGEIEHIRGVAVSSSILKTLLEREWIRIAGYKDVPGKPAVYRTTKQFLNDFNLQSIEQLPPLEEIIANE